jgi:hypothetical protein
MNKKTKLKLNETLDKALEPPKKRDISKLDELLSPYDVPDKPLLEIVPRVDHSTSSKVDHSTIDDLVEYTDHSTTPPKIRVDHSTTPPKTEQPLHQNKMVEWRKKDRHSKNKQRIQPSIDKAILKQIRRFIEKNEMELGEYFEMLALHHLDMVYSTNNESTTPQIDKKIIYRANISIINLYQTYLKRNKWTWNDDKEASRYSDAQIEAIEVAMIRTLIRAKNQVRTFKYFVPEIEIELAQTLDEKTRQIQLASARLMYSKFKQGIEVDAMG